MVVTLLVYWLAEQYAELLASPSLNGRLPTWAHIRSSLAGTWPMVTASFVPVVVLALAVLFGASSVHAAYTALFVAAALLVLHGYTAGRAAGLRGRRLLAVTAVVALLGMAMIFLKSALQHMHY